MTASPLSRITKVFADILGFFYLGVSRRRRVEILLDQTISPEGRFLVIERYEDFFKWNKKLYWEKNSGVWMSYTLEHTGSYWKSADLRLQNQEIRIRNDRGDRAVLNAASGEFTQLQENVTYPTPALIGLGSSPDQFTRRLYPDSRDWGSYWPSAIS